MEKSSKLPPLPLVLTGNDLRSGAVVFLGDDGWEASLALARVAEDGDAAQALIAIAERSGDQVIAAELVSIEATADGPPRPVHYREAIRADGPTVQFGEAA